MKQVSNLIGDRVSEAHVIWAIAAMTTMVPLLSMSIRDEEAGRRERYGDG